MSGSRSPLAGQVGWAVIALLVGCAGAAVRTNPQGGLTGSVSAGASTMPCGAPALPPDADETDRAIVRAMIADHIPGLSAVLLKDGKVTKVAAYGFADLESCVPATPDTVFGIGSISKQFGAVAALTLVRDGRLSLDEPILRWVPEGKGKWDGITVRALLDHTSGIPDYTGDDHRYPSMKLDRTSSPTTGELLRQVAAAPLNFRPGQDWAYSSGGYVVLGAIIERISGQPFADYVRDHVFSPLGMTATGFYSPRALIPHRATPYHVAPDGTVVHGPFISDAFSRWADMGIVSTARDMGRWLEAIGSDRLLPHALWTELWSPARLGDGARMPYGLGLQLTQVGGRSVLLHGGTFRVGYSAMEIRERDHPTGVAVLSNFWGDAFPPAPIARALVSGLDPALRPPEPTSAGADPHPTLTQSVVRRLRGLDLSQGAIPVTAAFTAHDEGAKFLGALLRGPDRAAHPLQWLGCEEASGRSLDAYGAQVARVCGYRVVDERGVAVQGVPSLRLWFTPEGALASIQPW